MSIREHLIRFMWTLGIGVAVWVAIYLLSFVATIVIALAALGGGGRGIEPLLGFLSVLPTFAIYGVASWIGWRGVRPFPWLGALVFVATVAIVPPFAINVIIGRGGAQARSGDSAFAAPGSQPGSIALLLSPNSSSRFGTREDAACGNLCQRLLYGGGVREVVMGRPPGGFEPAYARGLIAYRIERRATCPNIAVPLAASISGETHSWRHPVSTAVRQRIAEGECLVTRPVGRLEADHVWMEGDPQNPDDEHRLASFGNFRLYRLEHHARQGSGYRRVGRQTYVRYALARYPFFGRFALNGLLPRMEVWLEAEREAEAYPASAAVQVFRPWLPAPRGLGGARMRAMVDRYLASVAAPGSADEPESPREQLYWAYVDLLAGEDTQSAEDSARLARVIESPDFFPQRRRHDTVSALGKAIEGAASPQLVGEAVLRRAVAADPARDQLLLATLSDSLAWLPDDAFVRPSPLLDRVIDDPVLRGRVPEAVFRLGDRGATAAPLLLRIVEEALEHWADENRHPGSRAVVSRGIEAICRLAPSAPGAAAPTRSLIRQLALDPALHRQQIETLRASLRVMEGAPPRRREHRTGIIESC